jgi:hypothetical protein
MDLVLLALTEVRHSSNSGSWRIKLVPLLPQEWQVQVKATRGKDLKYETL